MSKDIDYQSILEEIKVMQQRLTAITGLIIKQKEENQLKESAKFKVKK